MRILYLLTQDLESPYGAGRCWPLAKELALLGHQVKIAALHSDFNSLDAKQQFLDGVNIQYVAPMHVMKMGSEKSYYRPHQLIWITLQATFALAWAALKQPFDIIYVGKPHPMNSIAGLLAKVLRRIPLIVDCDDYEAESGRFSGKWQKGIIELFEKKVPHYCEKVTTNTHFMRDNLISWGIPKDKIFYLPNGVDPERFATPDPVQVEAERKKRMLQDQKVIAYLGSLSIPSHPVDILIEAFAQIQKEIADVILMIVGGGEDLPNLQQKVAELGLEKNTQFVGRVPPKDIPLYYALADVSTDPIHDDPAARGRSPLKLFESWICGIPFVSADVGDRAFLMGDPPAGVLVSPEKKSALAKGIAKVLSDEHFSALLITRGNEKVKEFHWELLANSLEKLFFLFQK